MASTSTTYALKLITSGWLISALLLDNVMAEEKLDDPTSVASASVEQVIPVPNVSPANPPLALSADEPAASPCKDSPIHRTPLDRLQEKLSEWSCSSASWADGLVSDQHAHHNYRESHGEIFAGATWSQLAEVDKVLRFRAHLSLPGARTRWHAFVGRVDRNEFVTESKDQLHPLPVAFDRNLQSSVLLGLGYEEPMKKYGAFDADIGLPVDLPIDPYAKTSYRVGFPIDERNLVRFRETVFWQKSERFGTTTRADWDHIISDNNLLRWTASATRSQAIEGWRWYSTFTWYQIFNLKQAMAYELSARRDNTALRTRVDDFGFTTIYRHNFWRTWLWLEVRAGVDWPYQPLTQVRHSNLNALIGFEMRYGGQP